MSIDPELLQQCWFIAGPTASGKTATAIELAKLLDAEILSLDSMAIYRTMDIGTAKPTSEEQAQVPHHLIDLIDPDEEFSTAQFIAEAERVIQDLLARGKTPLFAGGTGLYLRSVLRGVFEGPAANWEFRKEKEKQEIETPGILHEELKKCDPASAKKLHPNDLRRVIRALEVYLETGTPLSEQQEQNELSEELRPQKVFWLHPDRTWLYERINNRVDLMIEQGLVQEVEQLIKRSPPPSRTAIQGLGYKEIIDYLEAQTPSTSDASCIENAEKNIAFEQAIETLKTRTRQFAKRQHTWFRNLAEAKEIIVTGNESAKELAQRIFESF